MLDDDVKALAREKNFAAFTTLFADGSPQTHIMWVDADEEYVYINTEQSRQKVRNIAGDPRVVVTIFDAADPYHYVEVRGVVVDVVGGDEGRAHMDKLRFKYTGATTPTDSSVARVYFRIAPDKQRSRRQPPRPSSRASRSG
jgi:PPOX class probable F420-dependent enzyme